MQNIQPLQLDHLSFINTYLAENPPLISECTFANLFIWQKSRPVFFTELGDSLLFLVKAKGEDDRYILFGPPLGGISLAEVFAAMQGSLVGAVRISHDMASPLPEQNYTIEEDHDNADYVYRVAYLASLTGRRYSKKRNQIKHCLDNHRCEYEEITVGNIAECTAMQEGWCRLRNCGHTPGLCSENRAIDELFAHYADFKNLIGGAIRVDGRIAAYAVGEKLHPKTAVWHFEKAMPPVQGLGQLITHWFAKYSLQDFDYVNREQDLGMPGLRQAKLSYYPHHMVDKYSVWLMDKPVEQVTALSGRCEALEE